MSIPPKEDENELDSEDFAQMNGISSTSPEMPPATTSYQDAAPEEFLTRRNTWEQPWPKALLVGSGILGLVAILGSMVHGTTEAFNGAVANQKNTASQSLSVDSRQASKTKETDTDGDKDAKVALTTQLNDLRNQKQHTDSTPPPSPLPTASFEPDELSARVQRRSRLPRAIPDDAPPQHVYLSTPSQEVPRHSELPVKPAEVAPLNPAQAWADASGAGTFGGVKMPQGDNPDSIASVTPGTDEKISDAGQFVDSKNVDGVAGGPTALPDSLSGKSKSYNDVAKNTAVPLSQSDAKARESQVFPSSNQTSYSGTTYNAEPEPTIRAGTRVKGVITAPIAWSSEDGNSSSIEQVASIQLRENLTDSDGQVVLPLGSNVIAKITRATTSGLVTMVATSAQTPQGDKSFPNNNSVLVLGLGGGVLRAKVELPGNTGDSLGTAIYAGINKGAETLNRPTSGSGYGYSGSGGGFQSFSFNSNNNVIAGVAEGVAGAMMQSGMARTQRRMERLQSQSPTYVIKEGTLVQIYFNQSIALSTTPPAPTVAGGSRGVTRNPDKMDKPSNYNPSTRNERSRIYGLSILSRNYVGEDR